MGPRAGLDGRKILSPPVFDPGMSSPKSVTLPTELPGHCTKQWIQLLKFRQTQNIRLFHDYKCFEFEVYKILRVTRLDA